MKTPVVPEDEEPRLRELKRLAVLDTPPEPAFDNITRLAANLLGVPIALVSLVDETRQWFKSHHGLAAEHTPREVSFCGHVVGDREALVVVDTSADERFADNPLVTGEPRVRFYAGYPLCTASGHILGTLCAIDHEPRSISDADQETLKLLAAQVVLQLELRYANARLVEDGAARLTAENALRMERERLRALFDGMSDGVVEQNQAGEVTLCNRAALDILGAERDELMGSRGWLSEWRWRRPDGASLTQRQHPSMRTLESGKSERDSTLRLVLADSERWVSLNTEALVGVDGSRAGVVTTIRDITGRRAREAELKRATELRARHDRLATTGTLAAGVGHEINNPLTFVAANLDLAIEEVGAIAGGSPSGRLAELADVLRDAREGSERIRKIVRGLRAFARDDAPVRATDLAAVIDISINMAMHEMRPRASVHTQLEPVPLAMADESRLAQVLVNLLVNAAQAFKDNAPSRNRVTVSLKPAGDAEVAIEVSDNGPGIAPDVLPRIFDPFFTTKPTGVGTGLGLSICHTLVTALGGNLTCETQPGEGTTFRVVLESAAREGPAVAEPQNPDADEMGRILVIDDEPGVLRIIQRALASDLHEVVALSSPKAALARVEAGEDFDLIICDMMMPELTGADFHRSLAELRPQLADRIAFMTGGITHADIQAFVESVPNEVLDKPFKMQAIRDLARRYVEMGKASRASR